MKSFEMVNFFGDFFHLNIIRCTDIYIPDGCSAFFLVKNTQANLKSF